MRSFDNKTRLKDDECALTADDAQNKNVYEYSIFNNYQTNKNKASECKSNYNKIMDFTIENHLNMRDGFGLTNACGIDVDSKVRNDFEMHDKGKIQLTTRTFTGVPNADKGGLEADIDAKLTQGTFTSKKETCEVLSEKCFDRFEPMPENILKSVQNVENIIPSWQWGGEGTRDVLSQRDFLEKNGYEYDGESWKKRCR